MVQRSHDYLDGMDERVASAAAAKSTLWKSLDLTQVLQASIEAACKATGLDTGAIYLLERNVLYLGAATPPLPPDFPDELRFASATDHPHIMRSIDTERPVYIEDLTHAVLTPAERGVTEIRDLRTIIYVPLFANDRPIGVFMVGSAEECRPLNERVITLTQSLAHSTAHALEDAHLFDSLMHATDDRTEDLRSRLMAIAATATCDSTGVPDDGDARARINRHLELLEIRRALLQDDAKGSLDSVRESSAAFFPFETNDYEHDLAFAREASRAFAHDRHADRALEFGIGPALEFLAQNIGVGPDAAHIRIDADAQMTDADTALLIFSSARDLLREIAEREDCVVTGIHMSVDSDDRVILEITTQGECLTTEKGGLSDLRVRLMRAGGEMDLIALSAHSSVAKVALPHFRQAR